MRDRAHLFDRLDEARWPPAGPAELVLRFGCGLVVGLVLGFGLVVASFPAFAVRPWLFVPITAIVCGIVAAWQWERFWRWAGRLASWLF